MICNRTQKNWHEKWVWWPTKTALEKCCLGQGHNWPPKEISTNCVVKKNQTSLEKALIFFFGQNSFSQFISYKIRQLEFDKWKTNNILHTGKTGFKESINLEIQVHKSLWNQILLDWRINEKKVPIRFSLKL